VKPYLEEVSIVTEKNTIMIEDFGSPEVKLTQLPHVCKEKAKTRPNWFRL